MTKAKAAEAFDELLEQLPDFDALAREIAKDVTLPGFELKNITDMVLAAGEKWLIQDLEDYEFLEIERQFSATVYDHVYSGTEDFKAIVISQRKPLLPYQGQTIIGDWKTYKHDLDPKFDARYREKWQWKLYSYFLGAQIFQYRGVNRKCDTRSLTLEIPPIAELRDMCVNQIRTVAAQIESQKQFPIWAMNMPQACMRYGEQYPCPFRDDCPQGGDPGSVDLPLRQTTMADMLHCPEYARRSHKNRLREEAEYEKLNGNVKVVSVLLGDEIDPYASYNEATVGQAFHRGIAELYRQGIYTVTGKDLSEGKRLSETQN